MILGQEFKAKRQTRVKKLLRKQYVSKQSTEPYKYWIAKSYSPSMSWKLNTSLTQKDTMDRGAWMKIQKEGHAGGLTKDKSPKAQKCKMVWEWETNEYFCLLYVTILWCPSWELPEDRGKKNEIHIPGLKRVI